jgi:predicted transcriptional regulator
MESIVDIIKREKNRSLLEKWADTITIVHGVRLSLLMAIYLRDELKYRTTPTALRKAFKLNKSLLNYYLKGLSQLGLVSEVPLNSIDPNEGEYREYVITEKGKQFLEDFKVTDHLKELIRKYGSSHKK